MDRHVDEACSLPNKALDELNKWCMANSLTPHSAKCEAVLFYRGSFIGPYPVITIGNETISWVCHARLLGITKDHKLTWTKHLTELKKNFVNNLNLLRKCSFLTRKSLLDLYFKTITYFIVASPEVLFRNNDYITLFIITTYNT